MELETHSARPIPCAPPLGDRLGRAGLRLSGFESRSLSTSVGRVHWLEARGGGRLPGLVLLHGFGSSSVHFGPLLWRLQRHVRRILAPDLPAHGFSDTPGTAMRPEALQTGLFEALDATLGEPAVFFGNSMGGLAAIRYAHHAPQRVRGLILCSPGGAPMEAEELDALVGTFRLRSHAEALDFVDRIFTRPTRLKHVVAWGARQRINRREMQDLLAALSLRHLLAPEDLKMISQPTLLLWGQDDRILPERSRDFFRAHLPPHAVIEEPRGFSHSPYLEQPGPVAERIRRFLAALD